MKTLEQIKEEYAKSHPFDNWSNMYSCLGVIQRQYACDEVAKRYAEEYAKEALRLASENADTICYNALDEVVDKDTILSEDNLPKH